MDRRITSYPPSPWRLTAHAYVGVFVVPRAQLPAPHSSETKPITILGRGIVAAAWFVYEEPSPLAYNEVMGTLLVRKGWHPLVSITDIWVDSVASRDGGRALWGIPKELAEFEVEPHTSYEAACCGTEIGSLEVLTSRQLPFEVPVGFSCGQDRAGQLLITKVRGKGTLGLFTGSWSFAASGPLGYLNGRKPLLSLVARPVKITFGT